MAFPVATTATTNGTTATGSPVVNLPASIAAGDLLLCVFRVAVAGVIGWPAGWTELFDGSPDAADDQMAMAWRKADGTEGATITLTCTSGKFAALSWRITGADTGGSSQLASDNFNRANENPIAGNWTSGTSTFTDLQIVSNAIQGVTASGDGAAFYNAVAWPNNHYSQVTLATIAASADGGPAVRLSAAAQTGYNLSVKTSGTEYDITKFIAGVATNLGNALRTFNAGDILWIEAKDQSISVFQNGVLFNSVADSSIASGNAGIFVFSNVAGFTLDNWAGGSLLGNTPQLSTVATGASTTPDPTTCTPTGGANDYLWLWVGGWEGEQTSPPASNPTNYSSPIGANSGTVGAVTTNVRVASAQRNLNAASEDPGSWTISVSDDWTAYTVAISPARVFPPNEYQNPLIKLPVISLRHWDYNLLQSTLGIPAVAPPFNLKDWPVPRGSGPSLELRTWLDQLKLNLQGKDKFFAAAGMGPTYDWPNPKGYIPSIDLKTWLDPLKLNLQSKDKFFGLSGNPTFDWPVPKGYIPSIELKTWIDPLKLNLAGKDKFFGLAGNPQFDWPVPKGYVPAIILKTWTDPVKLNLLGKDKFFGLGGNPNFDWPVPKGQIPAISLKTWIEQLRLLAGQDTFFGLSGNPNFDWPNPRGYIPAITLKTWTENLKLNLLGQDRFFGLAGNPVFDWPNPAGKSFSVEFRNLVNNLLQSTLSITTLPFGLFDWPNPRGTTGAITLRTWIEQLRLLAGQDQFFGLAGNPTWDWPVPKSAIGAITLRTWIDQLKLNLAGQDRFFGLAGSPNFDWPNPRGYIPGISLKTWLDRVKIQLIGQDQFFGLAGSPQFDWPNPKGYVHSIDLKTWLDSLKLNLAGQDKFFGLAGNPTFDWQNPAGVKAAISLRQWEINLLQNTLSFVQNPFSLSEWPNPQGTIPAVSLRTWIEQLRILAGQDQFFGLAGSPNFDWPNPKGYLHSISLRTWLDQLKLNLQGQEQFFGLAGNPTFDWPVPKGYIPASILRTWVDPLKLNLLNQDQFFGAAGQVPNYDWQNPRAARRAVDLQTWLLNLLLSTLGNPTPFSMSDWLNPKGAAFPSDLRGWLDQLKLNLLNQDQFFGAAGQVPANLDWPVPRTRLSNDLKTWIYPNLLGTTLTGTPFSMLDWQNPWGAIPAITLRTWLDLLKLNLLSQDHFFGADGQPPANLDWPVPKGKMDSIIFRIWLINLLESTLAPVVVPVSHCRIDASGRQVSTGRQSRAVNLDASGRDDIICP